LVSNDTDTGPPMMVVGSLAVGLLLAPPPDTWAEFVTEPVPMGAV